MTTQLNRRNFLRSSIAAGAALGLSGLPRFAFSGDPTTRAKLIPKADAMVLIYLPGGMAQHDLWDLKKYTPYEKGMKGSDLLGTCPAINTAADGIQIGAGLENLATVMDRATILRSLSNQTKF